MWLRQLHSQISRGRAYLFNVPTKSIEFLNGLCTLLFSLVLIGSNLIESNLRGYSYFDYVSKPWIGLLMLAFSGVQFKALFMVSFKSNIISVIILRVSSLMWVLWGVYFGVDYAFLSTGFSTYLTIAFICLMASYEQALVNRFDTLNRKACRNG